MKKLNSIFCILFFVSSMQAQVTYTLSPTNSVNLTLPLNQSTGSKIYQINTGSTKILLKWEIILVTLPVGWTYTSCDYGACYGGIPVGPTTMDSIPVSSQGLVGIDIDPGSILGSGIVKLYVYQDGYQANGDTLTWNITSTAVGIEEITGNDGIKIYPNPFYDLIHIDFSSKQIISSAYITDVLGRKVKSIEIFEMDNTINLSDLNFGYYNLVFETREKKLFKRIIKSN